MFPSEEVRKAGSTSVQPAQTGEPPDGRPVYGVERVVERAVAAPAVLALAKARSARLKLIWADGRYRGPIVAWRPTR